MYRPEIAKETNEAAEKGLAMVESAEQIVESVAQQQQAKDKVESKLVSVEKEDSETIADADQLAQTALQMVRHGAIRYFQIS